MGCGWRGVPSTSGGETLVTRCNLKLFVYGTLKRGQRNHFMMEDYTYLGPHTISDYVMVDLKRFPAAVPSEGRCIVGELYEVDDFTELDEFETDLYQRVQTCGVWVYTLKTMEVW
jgi:gamma-glutamylcyclotransferase (GGCT)/AIG2-like uncharacterized protein YtfP